MLTAMVVMYTLINSIIGTVLMNTAIGERKGSPTFCLFFIIYVSYSVKILKENCEPDGFWTGLHLLLIILHKITMLLILSRKKCLML